MNDLNSRLIPFSQRKILIGDKICKENISIVIPVKNDQAGVDDFLDSFFLTHSKNDYPAELIIVDNNSTPPLEINSKYFDNSIPIHLYHCVTPGAAAARNIGVNNANGKWILFTDSDCVATKTFVSGYQGLNSGYIAYAGHVESLNESYLDQYYDNQEVLIPPKAQYGELSQIPMYIVTANAIVYKEAYHKIGGFNECYQAAGGEDEDFSLRLWEYGDIGYAKNSVILHNYKNGIFGFIKRFINYGRGSFLTEKKWKSRKMPTPFAPKKKSIGNRVIAYFQYSLMLLGYWKARFNRHD